MKKRSFFERLTGAVKMDDFEQDHYNDNSPVEFEDPISNRHNKPKEKVSYQQTAEEKWMEEAATEGELTVDVYQTAEEIIIKTMVAGVLPEHIDISATRDMVTIKGHRESEMNVHDADYFHKELYWGTFSRSIVLPVEVEPEEAVVEAKNGLVTIKLPKINKGKQTKLKVKVG